MSSIEIIIIVFFVLGGLYTLWIGAFNIGWVLIKKTNCEPVNYVQISIIIPFRNEEAHLRDIINSLVSQNYPDTYYEIIMVDDHSGDRSMDIIQTMNQDKKMMVLKLDGAETGKKDAIKVGIQHATGVLIATLDADCQPGTNWLQSIANAYTLQKTRMLSGPVAINNPKGFIENFQALELLSLVGTAAGAIGIGHPIMCNGANLIYEKSAFEEVGGFKGNEYIPGGDDIFLLEKFKQAFGRKQIGFIKNRDAIVVTQGISSLKGFIEQRIRWVAKSPSYRDAALILTAILVLLFNLSLLFSLVLAFFIPELWYIFISLLALKSIVDSPILFQMTSFTQQRKLMIWYLPFQLIYFMFISFSGIMGNVISYRWKGRK